MTANEMKVTSKFSSDSAKVYINGILHIYVVRDKFIGLSSWQYEAEGDLYYIEIVLDGGNVAVNYDKREIWLAVLAELEKLR